MNKYTISAKEVFKTLPYMGISLLISLVVSLLLLTSIMEFEAYILFIDIVLILILISSILVAIASFRVLISISEFDLVRNKFLMYISSRMCSLYIFIALIVINFLMSLDYNDFAIAFINGLSDIAYWIMLVIISYIVNYKLTRKYLIKYVIEQNKIGE